MTDKYTGPCCACTPPSPAATTGNPSSWRSPRGLGRPTGSHGGGAPGASEAAGRPAPHRGEEADSLQPCPRQGLPTRPRAAPSRRAGAWGLTLFGMPITARHMTGILAKVRRSNTVYILMTPMKSNGRKEDEMPLKIDETNAVTTEQRSYL
eukprot:scaffold416285_cov30-Prasinocladus_malaysianus.AAC.1